MKNIALLVLMFFCCSAFMFAQQTLKISGTVIDQEGNPLPGASILIKGDNTKGTMSDFDGNFSIEVSSGEVLVVSYIGYQTQEVTVEQSTNLTITMIQSATDLDEVVVIGYGTQKKSDLTGAISSVKSDELLKQPAINAVQSIQGKLSGVNIVNTDAPGDDPVVLIRGVGTATSGNSPLYIVDGVQVRSISNINPADIETMDVMKDAASAAIYGMDAANGVIFITTKKGKFGKAKISLSSYYGTKTMLNPVEMANASQYITYFNEKQASTGASWLLSENQQYNTDWYDELTDVGFSNSNNVAVSGANENVSYFFSFNNYNEDGILEDQDLNRNTLRSNNTFKLFNDRVKISQNFSAAFQKETPKPYGSFNDAYRQSPLVPTFYPNGSFGRTFVNTTTGIVTYEAADGESVGNLNSIGNPLATVYFQNQRDYTTDLQGSLDLELKITDYLKVNSRYGATKTFYRKREFNDIREQWLSSDPTRTEDQFDVLKEANPGVTTYANNKLVYTNSESYRYNWDTFITFDKSFDKHSFNAVAGITKGARDIRYSSAITGYDVPELSQYWSFKFISDDYETFIDQYYATPIHQLSYYGRLQYNYDGKYFLQGNIRRDGVSTFNNDSNEEYYGNFPSFSAGWVISKEAFFENVKGIDFLKLRGGWGKLGNSDVTFNTSVFSTSTGSSNVNYVFGANQDLVFGAALGAPVYPISWEVTKETNIGLDFATFESKLSGSLNYYNRNTENAILLVTPVYTSAAQSSFYDHGAEITNKGFEIELNWKNTISEDFSYNVGLVFATNKNNVENVKPAYDGQTGGSLANGQITKRLQEDQPLYAWWMWEADGVWQSQDEIDNNAHYGSPKPGYLRYKDQNNDGVIDDKDKKFFGSYLPTYNIGINMGINYKNFDFAMDAFGAGGNKIYNGLKGTRIDGGENITSEVFNQRWTGAGSTNTHPGANRDSYASSYYLEDGDYLRINNITIGYTLPKIMDAKIRVYATAKNPFLFTKYSGFTPEIVGSSSAESKSANGTSGIELSAYPNTRTFLFGINVDL